MVTGAIFIGFSVFYSLQYVRFVAALLVVIYHGTQSLQNDLGSEFFTAFRTGSRGVDIFFVLAGFIIFYVLARKKTTRSTFVFRRILRIAPIYYLATLTMLAVAFVAPRLLASTQIDAVHIIASFIFIPVDHPVLASTFPFLPVGWTLNSEFQFYLIASVFMFATIGLRLVGIVLSILALVMAGQIFQTDNQTVAAITAPMHLEFLIGVILSYLWCRGAFAKLPAWLGVFLTFIAVGLLLFIPADLTSGILQNDFRWFYAGGPAGLLLAGLLILEARKIIIKIESIKILGDASYSLYVWHFFVIGAVRAVWPSSGLFSDILFLTVVIFTSVIVSLISYFLIERRIAKWSERLEMAQVSRSSETFRT